MSNKSKKALIIVLGMNYLALLAADMYSMAVLIGLWFVFEAVSYDNRRL